MNIPAELVNPLLYAAVGLGGATLAVGIRAGFRAAARAVATRASAPKSVQAKPAKKTSARAAAPTAIQPEYVLVADHDAVVSVLKGEVAELRSTVIALEIRMQALKQRQDHQLEALTAGRDIEERSASFTTDDLVALARQGWAARELARVAHLSMAEAELLTRLHGHADTSSVAGRVAR